jgi:prefoldin subunit 5
MSADLETKNTDSMDSEHITVGTDDAGGDVTLPLVELLTGRGFVTGKSGSGKSNTASVIAEELLDAGYPLLIVDTDGEYYGLKEEYELLHAGADEECDIQVGAEHAEKVATLALEENVPIILDVSGYLDEDEASELIRETAHHLFTKEKKLKKPFLLVVEEVHEYIPEGGGLDDTGQMLIKIGKRGRKHGLGLVGISQRPADVKKDFITQANWLAWHRLTWENDTKVVGRVVSKGVAEQVQDLADGEAFLQADWDEADVRRVQFRRKRTFDAGATPGLNDFERPELKSVGEDLVDELEEISDRADRRQDRIADLERQLEAKDERIEDLQQELENQEDIADAAQQMAEALRSGAGDDADDVPADWEQKLEEKNETIRDLRDRVDDLEAERDALQEDVDDLQDEVGRLESYRDRVDQAEEIEEQLTEIEAWFASAPGPLRSTAEDADEMFADVGESGVDVDEDLREELEQLREENERLREKAEASDGALEPLADYESFLDDAAVKEAIDKAKQVDRTSPRYIKGVIATIVDAGGIVSYDDVAQRLDLSTTGEVSKAASVLEARKIVEKEQRDDGMHIDLNVDGLNDVREAAARREKTEELMEEL